MRKILLISICIAIFFACAKNGNNQRPSLLFSFQLDDSTYTFDSTSTIIDTIGGNCITTINAFNTKTNSFVITHLQSNTTSEKGSYMPSTPQTPYNLINIFITILSDGQSTNYTVEDGPFVLIINQASNDSIQGSFSGTIYNVSTRGNSTLSNGQFNMPVQYQ
jgi:hypothetical protein